MIRLFPISRDFALPNLPRSIGVLILILWLNSLALANPEDLTAVYQIHNSWKLAVEQADIARVSRIWAHSDQIKLINLFDETRLGWDQVHAELFQLFQWVGQTQITTENLLITLAGDRASATSDYWWSPIPKIPLFATELYQKIDGIWKMVGHDATGTTLVPLRPVFEAQIRHHLALINQTVLLKNADLLAERIAFPFFFTQKNGKSHDHFVPDKINSDLASMGKSQLEVVFLTDEAAFLYYRIDDPQQRRLRFDLIPPDWQIQRITFKATENPLPVFPRMKLALTWATLKMTEKTGRSN